MFKYLSLLLFLTGCNQWDVLSVPISITPSPTPTQYSFTNIVAFGDSITVGSGATEGFVYRIADVTHSTVQNYGVGSTKIANQMPIILNTIIPPNSRVIFLTGMNDVIHNGDDPVLLNNYLTDLKQAWDLWESEGVDAFVGTTLKVSYNALMYFVLEGFAGNAYTPQLYANSVLALYNTNNYKHIHIVDTYDGYLPDDSPNGNSKDGIHPNDIGAQIVANRFLEYLY